MDLIPVRRALISVSDKTGLEAFAKRLVAAGVEIVSSGGTASALEGMGIAVRAVSDVTGFPEILGGRVKTLHPLIHGAILADPSDPAHRADLEEAGIEPFQLVVVNLYPFRETVATPGITAREAIEQIDIGGPAMVRAAAKNHAGVGVVTSPEQYSEVAGAVEAGGLGPDLRLRLAREAFFHTASYDAAIVAWFERDEQPPARHVEALERDTALRYGENPHQQAGLYRNPNTPSWWENAHQLQGKEMSFNNYVDADAAYALVHEFDRPACVIVKHTNPCGVAVGDSLVEAFEKAWRCDPTSAFGSVIALNRPLDGETSRAVAEAGFIEVLIGPAAVEVEPLDGKKNLRIITAPFPARASVDMRRLDGGFVAQTWDLTSVDSWETVSERQEDHSERADLEFAWRVVAHTKSNAIVIARNGQAFGIGAGDQSRVGATRRSLSGAGERSAGAVCASDAFFPFRDSIDDLAAAGITAIVEPGGSIRDEEVTAAADEHGIALIFTGRRHFKH